MADKPSSSPNAGVKKPKSKMVEKPVEKLPLPEVTAFFAFYIGVIAFAAWLALHFADSIFYHDKST
jgi:hypothetical protein